MQKVYIFGFLLLLALILQDAQSNAASLNAETLLFGSVFPSTAAATTSCISITAQAELLFDTSNISPEETQQWSASTHVCPTAASENSRVPYTLIFEDLHVSNFSSRQVAIKIQAIQKAAGFAAMELRWSRTISLYFSAGSGAAENLDLDLQQAMLYSSTTTTSKRNSENPPRTTSKDFEVVAETPGISEKMECVPLLEEDLRLNLKSSAAAQSLVALLCLAAGIVAGRAVSVKMSHHKSSPYKKQTCEVACSPLILEKIKRGASASPACGAAGGGKSKPHRWIRDHEGRLQREKLVKRSAEAAAALSGGGRGNSGVTLLGEFSACAAAQEEGYLIDIEQ